MARQDFQGSKNARKKEKWSQRSRQKEEKESGHAGEVKAMNLGAAQRLTKMG